MRIYADLMATEPELYAQAIRRGLSAKPPISFNYLKLATDHWDGQPVPALPTEGVAVSFTLRLSQGAPPALSAGPIIDVTHDDHHRDNGHTA